jgi:MFS family permease
LIPINLTLAFSTVAVLMLFCLMIMMFTVKEKDSYGYQQILEMEKKGEKVKREEGPFQSLIDSFREIATSKDKSIIALLLGIILCFCGWTALNALSSVYFADVLGMERGMAGTMLIFLSISYIIMTIPSGIIATKIGRRITIKIGLIITAFGIILGYLFQTPMMIIIGFIIAGIGFSFVTIHAVVILWELVPSQKMTGTYSGIYFLAVFLGAILGPIIVGFMTDFLGNVTFFLIISIFFLGDLVCMFFVKRGEAGDIER